MAYLAASIVVFVCAVAAGLKGEHPEGLQFVILYFVVVILFKLDDLRVGK